MWTQMILSSFSPRSVRLTTPMARAQHRERFGGVLHQDHRVERVAVLVEHLREEAVVGRVRHRRVHNAVDAQNAEVQIELVLRGRLARDFDDEVELIGRVGAEGDFVPGMKTHGIFPS